LVLAVLMVRLLSGVVEAAGPQLERMELRLVWMVPFLAAEHLTGLA